MQVQKSSTKALLYTIRTSVRNGDPRMTCGKRRQCAKDQLPALRCERRRCHHCLNDENSHGSIPRIIRKMATGVVSAQVRNPYVYLSRQQITDSIYR